MANLLRRSRNTPGSARETRALPGNWRLRRIDNKLALVGHRPDVCTPLRHPKAAMQFNAAAPKIAIASALETGRAREARRAFDGRARSALECVRSSAALEVRFSRTTSLLLAECSCKQGSTKSRSGQGSPGVSPKRRGTLSITHKFGRRSCEPQRRLLFVILSVVFEAKEDTLLGSAFVSEARFSKMWIKVRGDRRTPKRFAQTSHADLGRSSNLRHDSELGLEE